MKKNVYCGNCGEFGHLYRRCTQPITSLGLISYRIDNNKLLSETLFIHSNEYNFK